MSTANKVLIHRWFDEVWNKKREAAIFEMLHPECSIFGLSDSPTEAIRGPGGFIPFWRKFTEGIPDLHVAVESVVTEEDKIAARCNVCGQHTGAGLGIPPTGAQVAFTGMCLGKVRDGKLFEAWNNFDFLLLYRQLGVVRMQAT
jgi:predicted ester cyclase